MNTEAASSLIKTTPVIQVTYEPLFLDTRPPEYATAEASGADAFAYLENRSDIEVFTERNELRMLEGPKIELQPGWRARIPLGFKGRIPAGYEVQVRPRSGMTLRLDLGVANAPGTLDSDYPGEWGVIAVNRSQVPVTIWHEQRIAQLVLAETKRLWWVSGTVGVSTDRVGGFGSTGG